MDGKIVYIAGPMSGIEGYNRAAFTAAHLMLAEQGYTVIDPGALPIGMPDNKYLPICIAMVEAADALYMLPGWRESKGAMVEYLYAKRQGKEILNVEAENG